MPKILLNCEIEFTMHLIGGKYKALILDLLLEDGPRRFNQLLGEIHHISQKTLTNQLRELESDGLIARRVFPQKPPRVEYSITEKGRSLEPILQLMCSWGYQHLDDRFALINPQCGETAQAALSAPEGQNT